MIIKNCKKHGNLHLQDVIKSGKEKSGTQKYKCKNCMKDIHNCNYAKNKEKILKKHAEYRKDNPEQYKKSKRESWLKYRDKYLEKDNKRRLLYKRLHPEKIRARGTKRKDELQDSYIKKILMNRTNLKSENIPVELIEMKRAIMMLKRGIKDSQKNNRIEKLRKHLDEIEINN